MSRLVRKIVGVAERQEAFASGTSRPLPCKADHSPNTLSWPTGSTADLAGESSDVVGSFAQDRRCHPPIPPQRSAGAFPFPRRAAESWGISMYRKTIAYCSSMSTLKVLALGLVLGLGIEVLTIGGRFGLGVQTATDTTFLGELTFGLRIHHGYIGIMLLPIGWLFFRQNHGLRNLILMIGIGLLLSDLIHHFLVLWSVTGSPEFDLFYPDSARSGSGPRGV